MKTKFENKPTTPAVPTQQVDKCQEVLKESIFLENGFFLTGQNLPGKTCKAKARVEMEREQNNSWSSLQKG